jgi:nitrosocyanin
MSSRLLVVGVVAVVALAVGTIARPEPVAGAPMKVTEATFLNVDLEGSKIWLPGVLVLKRGEDVKVRLINKHKDPHGFAIAELKVQAVVEGAATAETTFKATRVGTFRLYCQLHAAHIGGQIIVNP